MILLRLKRYIKPSPSPWPAKCILLVSIQKSGTHLIQNVLSHLGLVRSDQGGNYNIGVERFRGLKGNEYLWSHFPPQDNIMVHLEADLGQDVRIIFNFRDPRDSLVSWFHWMHAKEKTISHPFHAYMKKVYSGFSDEELMDILIHNDKFRYNEYHPLEQLRYSRVLLFHPRVLKVRFEDLVGPEGGGSTERQVSAVHDLCSYLDIEEIDHEAVAATAFNKGSPTFRKGRIGGYRDVLSNQQLSMIDELYGDLIRHYGYERDGF